MPQSHRRHDARSQHSQTSQHSQQAQRHRSTAQRPTSHRRGPAGLVTCLALLIGVAVSVWIVVSPTSHADGLSQLQAAAGTPQHRAVTSGSTEAAENATTPKSAAAPTTTASASRAPAQRWRYKDLCPEKTLACVDLKDKVSWLQINGVVMYGPVRIEPGSPGQVTPVGNFTVSWKDKHHVSGEFNEAMPDAVFFAPGGIAFHVGSLTKGSHGCVHMTVKDANYYYDQLAVGATVSVF